MEFSHGSVHEPSMNVALVLHRQVGKPSYQFEVFDVQFAVEFGGMNASLEPTSCDTIVRVRSRSTAQMMTDLDVIGVSTPKDVHTHFMRCKGK